MTTSGVPGIGFSEGIEGFALGASPDQLEDPGPTPSEIANLQEQTALLRDQRDILSRQVREQNLLAPFLFEESGVTPLFNTRDPETGKLQDPSLGEGEIIAFERVDDPLDPIRKDIERGFLERTQAALAGELPINPALTSELESQRISLDEALLKQLGTGFQTSTPGIEAIGQFERGASEIRESARRGDLTLSEQLGLARQGANESNINETIKRLFGISGRDVSGIQAGLGIQSGLSDVLASFAGNRQDSINIASANLATQTSQRNTQVQAVGTAAATVAAFA